MCLWPAPAFPLREMTSSTKQGFIAPSSWARAAGASGPRSSSVMSLLLLSPPLYRCGHREQELLVCVRAQEGFRAPQDPGGGGGREREASEGPAFRFS